MALVGALVAVPLAVMAGYGVEVAGVSNDRAAMQAAADSAALAGAIELSVLTRSVSGIQQTARDHAMAQLTGLGSHAQVSFNVEVSRAAGAVTVSGVAERPSSFGFLGTEPVRIEVSATAEMSQSSPLCILQTQRGQGPRGLNIADRATVRAPTCLVHANRDIAVMPNANVTAGTIQAVGTITGPVSGNPGAMAISDPFANLDLAPPQSCPANAPDRIVNGNTILTLSPGVHCGELQLGGNATLQLLPGEHWFLGEIEFRGNARLRGDDVVLIFGGDDEFDFGDRADVELTARRSGRLAGFLIATTRDNVGTFSISSNRVRELLGTIYIPNAHLVVRTTGNVAQDSAWSVIVAQTLTLLDSPTLVINTGYVGSGVPVPDGVGPAAGPMRLVR